ncbi:hypothetical protein GOP47_0014805 [Adiantum capillus-veneris]|uniref:Uncharacterized protein n=1 Tax=Adiantum capillus-veneris TaxID=13818 RepID=A0A9D4ZDU8_ADICA|nr:hypothetical protein GOP47_0014805 [Adiantum capillus-veneris]
MGVMVFLVLLVFLLRYVRFIEPRKNVSLARTVHPKSGISKRECVRVDVSESSASTPITSRKRIVYNEPNLVIQPSPSKGKGQACSAQVGCSKAQKAKMAIVKIERHDALIDTEDDEVRVNPFPQQEPRTEEHAIRFFLDEAASAGLGGAKSYLGTLDFVVIKSENFEIYANSTSGELLVVDGSAPKDRATGINLSKGMLTMEK